MKLLSAGKNLVSERYLDLLFLPHPAQELSASTIYRNCTLNIHAYILRNDAELFSQTTY
jgi:hypothetical protein